MYILIEKESEKVTVFEAKSDLANKIGVHRNTITNKFKGNTKIETNLYTIYKADDFKKRKRGGNKDSLEIKKGKIEGTIPKNSEL